MANEQNQDKQNQNTQNTQNTTPTSDFGTTGSTGDTDTGQNFGSPSTTGGTGSSIGSPTGSPTTGSTTGSSGGSGASARQAKEGSSSGSETSVTDSVKSTAKNLIDQAKDTAGQAYGAATEKATTKLEEQKTNLASGLTSVADSVKQVTENLKGADDQTGITNLTAKYADTFASQIEQISGYFERKDVREMVRDVESFARRNPAIFIGGAFALGLLAARFLKSSSPKQLSGAAGASFSESNRSTENSDDNVHVFNSGTEQQGVTFEGGGGANNPS